MRIYAIRWNTGGFAVVAANSKRQARERFDEWGDTSDFPDDEIREIEHFGADFTARDPIVDVPMDTFTFDVDFSGVCDPLLPSGLFDDDDKAEG
jgi:hypothetical protein